MATDRRGTCADLAPTAGAAAGDSSSCAGADGVWVASLRTPRRTAVLLIALTALVYGKTLGYGFVYEDLNDVGRLLGSDVWAWPGWHRLLTSISFSLSRLISAEEPWGFHLVSVALHLLNGALLCRLLGGTWAAVFALGLFLLHPLQVESVAYISARADLLLVTMVLCGLWAVERGSLLGMLLASIGAVLAKEAGVVALPLCLLWGLWRARIAPHQIGAAALVSLPLVGVVAWRFADHLTVDLAYTLTELMKVISLSTHLLVPLGLTIDHDWGWIDPAMAVWGAVVVALWGAYALTEPRARFAFVYAWCAIALAPRLLIPLLEGVHEHHLYLPMLGLALGIGASRTNERTVWASD